VTEPVHVSAPPAEGQANPLGALACVERELPGGLGSTWVHAYSGVTANAFRRLAFEIRDKDPDAKAKPPGQRGEPAAAIVAVAQLVTVCRTEPGGQEGTFRLDAVRTYEGYLYLEEVLPRGWVQAICRESDALALEHYLPRETSGKRAARAEVASRLGEQLADPDFWTALDLSFRKLSGGRSLCENGQPLGEVLTLLEHDQAARGQMTELFASMMGAAGGI
jgi:hypothetical protein